MMISRKPRSEQRVYFENTPWWVPLGVVSLALLGATAWLGLQVYGSAGNSLGAVHAQMTDAVEAFRGGDVEAVTVELAAGAHVIESDGLVTLGVMDREGGNASVGGEQAACWVVRVRAASLAELDAGADIAGPLPGNPSLCGINVRPLGDE